MKEMGALAAAVLASLSQAVCAQAGDAVDRLKACSQFEGMERLKCVDELLGEIAEPPDSAPTQGPNWIISETTSPVDYRPQIGALTTARCRTALESSRNGSKSCFFGRCRSLPALTAGWRPDPR